MKHKRDESKSSIANKVFLTIYTILFIGCIYSFGIFFQAMWNGADNKLMVLLSFTIAVVPSLLFAIAIFKKAKFGKEYK